ncbi:chemotaxis protein methyltransferase CheR [Bacillus ectoiniformans]|uniref:CheR family methyltransferase n=1 Tax=Bacillus ectoiniformans TaxID=1494429 RepID=UPI001957C362|nr:protein-glutamate O-methyltransferase CheR [Bacillus ectoiniformans]MBM7648722.1 chemotaxis protein methyltransferase CheR [Bacillus ectoiniformans]
MFNEELHEDEKDPKVDLEIDLLLQGIYRLSGFDFRQYMRSSITRRVQHRMKVEKLPSVTRLLEKVINEPAFLEKVLNDFSINVTEMYRDPAFFHSFRENVIPVLAELDEIRIWHAGCSSGEEVYSMAILLQEEGLFHKARIYATDMNEAVLNVAKQGVFPISKMKDYTKNYFLAGGKHSLSEYYTTDEHFAYLDPALLKKIHFAQHNLVTDQSFNEFHVILCRNVLIYFTVPLQNKVHDLFYSSLTDGGFLGLGIKESLRFSKYGEAYEEFCGFQKIYRKK